MMSSPLLHCNVWRYRVRLPYLAIVIVMVIVFSFLKWKSRKIILVGTIVEAPKLPAINKENQWKILNEYLGRDNFFYWRNISKHVSVFSAYYDDREVLTSPQVNILGFEKQENLSTIYHCLLFYKNKHSCEINSSTLFTLASDHWLSYTGEANYRPFSFTCPLPTTDIPEHVVISSTKNCIKNVKQSKQVIPVMNRKGKDRKTFAVCVCSPMFKTQDVVNVVAYFEMNRLLGADFFTVYVYDVPPEMLGILQKYSKDGLAEIIENWGVGMPQPVHYNGQLLSINDCLYKNIYTAKYLVYVDIDEVIMPLRHPNWPSLLQAIDKPKQGGFLFENTFLYLTKRTKTLIRKCNGRYISFLSPKFLKFRSRSKVILGSKRTKYITKTAVTLIAQVHFVSTLARGYESRLVPVDQALLYHYRVPYKNPVTTKNNRTRDNIMVKYYGRLLSAITDRLC